MHQLMRTSFSIMSTTKKSTATAALMKRELNSKVGFYEVAVPSLVLLMSSDFTFESPKTLSKYLHEHWQLKVQFLQEIALGETNSTTEADFGFSLQYTPKWKYI